MTTSARPAFKTWTGRVLRTTLTLALGLGTLAGVVLAGATATGRDTNGPPPPSSTGTSSASLRYAEPAGAADPTAHGRRLVVAFVVGTSGTVASDLLAPYDIFASSPAFSTYVVAATSAAAPLEGAPAVVPTYTFAEVDADPALTPDLVVVPGLTQPTGTSEAPLRSWVTRQHNDGAKVLGVCSGSLVLAATGMLDGLHATSHWSRISALEASRPAVDWMRGRLYVEDGSITTTAAVTSGVPAALHLVAELVGPVEAQRVADRHPELRWTPAQATDIPEDHFAVPDWPVGLNYAMPWFRPTVGIALEDGVGELDATAAFEVYSQSAAARTVALATSDSVRTRHGLVLLTTSFEHARGVSRVVVPGADTAEGVDRQLRSWADEQRLSIEPLTGLAGPDSSVGGGGFSAALQNLAHHTDAATTSATAKMIGYATSNLELGNQHRSLRPVLLGIATLALAVLVGLAPALLGRRRRSRGIELANGPATVALPDPEGVNATV
jgi:putative intracellular protease/amidase